ncbi:dihydrolipoamide acetyltransferase family protein [Rubrobacter indicoceani]|uniref:dihydrolipoamide acetyltransferase family protein n=1 Tax=Rubrobacter indicoceani TaxID=2051957 RepID=UPI000E5ACAAE|nr:dihydrolipoamide acetyltransferase family protein [Rubrobacter indicoceani]
MSETIKMPQLGESVTEGTIARWLKSEGDEVELDEPIAEIDTDKVSTELPSPVAGRLEEILVGEGETVDVGVGIASIHTAEGAISQPDGAAEWPVAGTEAQPEATGASRGGAAMRTASTNGGSNAAKTAGELRLTRSSPVVRRLAAEHGLEIASVPGTGTGGRVTKKDILAFAGVQETVPPTRAEEQPYFAPPETPEDSRRASPVEVGRGDETMPLTSIRRAISNRMSRSKHEAPHAWTMVEVDMTGLVKLREASKGSFEKREGISLTYLPFIIEAVAASLKEHPVVNSVWGEDGILLRRDLNVGVAVDIEDAADARNGALVVPVIRRADGYSVTGLARKTSELVKKARKRQLTPDDLSGGTFTVNNPGALGSVVSVPIINHPQAAILSAEAIVKRPVVLEEMGDAIAVRSMMNLEISFDHRIFDGGVALRFLDTVKRRLEGYGANGNGA